VGIDGCSAPNFAVPLYNAAYAYARLADPRRLSPTRAKALSHIFRAMNTYPDMVGGPGRFDTQLMKVGGGNIVSKGGAEGYHGIALAPGVLGKNVPGVGIAYKISDGDPSGRADHLVGLEILRQLGALQDAQLRTLREFDSKPLFNFRRLQVGMIRPCFMLEKRPVYSGA
jgi:L-asparaginase II